MGWTGHFGRVLAAVAGGAVFMHQVMAGDMEVLESNVPAYKVGDVLPDNKELDLPPGGRIKVLLGSPPKTKVFCRPGAANPNQDERPIGGSRNTNGKDCAPS